MEFFQIRNLCKNTAYTTDFHYRTNSEKQITKSFNNFPKKSGSVTQNYKSVSSTTPKFTKKKTKIKLQKNAWTDRSSERRKNGRTDAIIGPLRWIIIK